jgi:tetratricopeptide (TPR) repeat protein
MIGNTDVMLSWVMLANLNSLRPESLNKLAQLTLSGRPVTASELSGFNRYFAMVVKLYPTRADAHGLLGYTEFHGGDLDSAQQSYERSVYLQPGFFWTNFNLGVVYFQQGDFVRSSQLLVRALACDTAEALAFILESRRLYLPSVHAQGLKSNQDIVQQINQAKVQAYELLALNYWRLQQTDRAVTFSQTAVKSLGQKAPGLKYFAALGALREGDEKAAVDYLQQSIEEGFRVAEAYVLLAKTAALFGQEKTAQNALHTARQLNEQGQTLQAWANRIQPGMY